MINRKQEQGNAQVKSERGVETRKKLVHGKASGRQLLQRRNTHVNNSDGTT